MNQRKLPIGIQDFEKLRKNNFLYVDKTEIIYNLVQVNSPYFLSRPRRFGKSLLLSTLEAYFLGKKELFTGLAIEKLEKDWNEYPVLKISFGAGSYESKNRLLSMLEYILRSYEEQYEIKNNSDNPAVRLNDLIINIYKKTGKQVVILIDEYDKPILDALYTDLEEENRQELRNFYSPLKDCDQYIRFLFITGVTKVSHVNIFSGLNQLNDISLNKAYSSICGITETELSDYFMPEITALAKEQEITVDETKRKLADMYDGYHFSHNVEGVYNPFCLLKCLDAKDFGSYWFESGTPSFIVKTLQNQPLELSSIINGRKAKEEQFKNYDPESKNMLPVIYQSGYLTIKDYEKQNRIYTLDFPNREIEEGFINVLLKKIVKVPYDDLGLTVSNICNALELKDIDKALTIIKAAIADLPTIVQKDMCENYYESVTHLIFRMTGYWVVSELQSVSGRSDIVVSTKDSVFIFELKMDKGRDYNKVVEETMEQIDEKAYSDRFSISGKSLYKIGLVFSSEGKGLIGWKVR